LYPKEQALDQTEEEGEEEKAFSMRQATTWRNKPVEDRIRETTLSQTNKNTYF
jgi:hypothetical protein